MQQKGVLIRSLLAAVEKVYGAEGLALVKAALPAGVRAQIEPKVIPVQWYPVEVIAELQSAIRQTVGRGAWEVSHRLGLEAARADFSGIYRGLVLRAVHYDTIWDRLERAWGAYNSQGVLAWRDRTPGHALCVVTGVSGFNPGMWHGAAGRSEGILLLSGARSVSTTVKDATAVGARIDVLWFD